MKLNHFKFQDGKVFWLPEYPEKGPNIENFESYSLNGLSWYSYALAEAAYTSAVAQSLASAIEVAPEDQEKVKYYIKLYIVTRNPGVGSILYHNLWQSENGKVYSAECEMETHYEEIVRGQWISSSKGIFEHVSKSKHPDDVRRLARLKPKDEIFPAANSHDMKDDDL